MVGVDSDPAMARYSSSITRVTRLCWDQSETRRVKILIIDAEPVVAEMLLIALDSEGARAMTAYDGAAAMSAARQLGPDVIILDPRLPDMDGNLPLQHLRERHPTMSVILLQEKAHRPTAKNVRGDACMSKPFSIEDALAQVRRVLRDNGATHASVQSMASVGDLVIDEDTRHVSRDGDTIILTPTEFKLLRLFVRNAFRPLSTQEILGRVWHYQYTGRPAQVQLYVSYLRRRIDYGRVPTIHTLRGTGYVLRPSITSHSDEAAGRPLRDERIVRS